MLNCIAWKLSHFTLTHSLTYTHSLPPPSLFLSLSLLPLPPTWLWYTIHVFLWNNALPLTEPLLQSCLPQKKTISYWKYNYCACYVVIMVNIAELSIFHPRCNIVRFPFCLHCCIPTWPLWYVQCTSMPSRSVRVPMSLCVYTSVCVHRGVSPRAAAEREGTW